MNTDANTDDSSQSELAESAHSITADSIPDQAITPETLEMPNMQTAENAAGSTAGSTVENTIENTIESTIENTVADIPTAKRVSPPVLNWQTQRMQEATPSTLSFEVESPAVSAEKATVEVQAELQAELQTDSQVQATAEPVNSLTQSPTDAANPQSTTPESANSKTEKLVEIAQSLPSNSDLAASFAAAANRQSDPAVAFTEPSPWGSPLPKARPQAPSEQGAMPAAASAVTNQDYLPALEPISTVSPLVNPLRTQKKERLTCLSSATDFPQRQGRQLQALA